MNESPIEVIYNGHVGTDIDFVNAARISLYSESIELTDKDIHLMEHLGWATPPHTSPFEHCYFRVIVKCPLYIAMEVLRHRTFSYNMVSRRYTNKNISFFMYDHLNYQNKNNMQGASGPLPSDENEKLLTKMRLHIKSAEYLYNDLINAGVAKEQARVILPQNLMTEFWMSGNFKNWVGFLKLRDHPAAQKEIQLVAQKVGALIRQYFPEGMRVLFDGKPK